jgi:hypothetical protein
MDMKKTLYFKSSLSCGDMIYSLLTVKALCKALDCKAVYYIKQTPYNPTFDTLEACKRLFLEQHYISECKRYSGQVIDVDFDKWRGFYSYDTPIPLQLAATAQRQIHTKFAVNYTDNWLQAPVVNYPEHTMIANTTRYQDFAFDFHKQILLSKRCLFIGSEAEYARYETHANIRHVNTTDLYFAAMILNGAKEIFCNQSAVLTIAQGLGKAPLYLAKDRGFNSTILGKEQIL